MIALATGSPNAEIDGDRILVSFPSGKDTVQASLSLNQALHLFQCTKVVAIDALDHGFAAPAKGDLAAFPTKEAVNG